MLIFETTADAVPEAAVAEARAAGHLNGNRTSCSPPMSTRPGCGASAHCGARTQAARPSRTRPASAPGRFRRACGLCRASAPRSRCWMKHRPAHPAGTGDPGPPYPHRRPSLPRRLKKRPRRGPAEETAADDGWRRKRKAKPDQRAPASSEPPKTCADPSRAGNGNCWIFP